MKSPVKKIQALIIMISLTMMSAALISACGQNKPIDESKLPALDEIQQEEGMKEQGQGAQQDTQQDTGQGSEEGISERRAKEIALAKVPGASEKDIVSFGRERDFGRWIYEGEIRYEGLEYEFEIDAQTGNILEWEIDD